MDHGPIWKNWGCRMSKFVKNLFLQLTDRKYPAYPNITVEFEETSPHESVFKEYLLTICFEQHLRCKEGDNEELLFLIKATKEKFRREIYGEFEDNLYKLLYAINSQDHKKSFELVRELISQLHED